MKRPAGNFCGGKAQGWLPSAGTRDQRTLGRFKALNVVVRGELMRNAAAWAEGTALCGGPRLLSWYCIKVDG